MSAENKAIVGGEQTNATLCGQTHLFGNQKVSVVRINCALLTVVYAIVFVHLALWIVVLELKHDVCETVYGGELFRSVSMNFVKVQVGADPPRGVCSLIGSRRGRGWE